MAHYNCLLHTHVVLQCISGLEQTPWLFPYEKLEFQEELGSGAFGVVKKALAHGLQPGEPATVIAVKMLKGNKSMIIENARELLDETMRHTRISMLRITPDPL